MKALLDRQARMADKSIEPPGPDLTGIGNVMPFPQRSCVPCGAPRRMLGADHSVTPYGEFSFLPIALKRWRMQNGLKISAAAEGLGVAASAWGHWETGARFPSGSVLLALVPYTGLSLAGLLCG